MRINKFLKPVFSVCCFLLLFILMKLFNFSADYKTDENPGYSRLNVPRGLNFAGDAVPINDFSIVESLDREVLMNTCWQSQTLLLYKRANTWFPVIEPILKRYGIPDDFKYIAVVESGLTNSVSAVCATGYWQLVEETAKSYGLEIDSVVDERYNMEKSTEAACKYFKVAYAQFNNWTLVAASYNMGIAGIQRALDKQKAKNYYDLYLNEETARYVFRILAVKDVLSRPKAYGYLRN